jgi:hypothetical protein
MKAYEGGECIYPRFLDFGTSQSEWSDPRPGRFTPGERAPGTLSTGGWMGLRAGLEDEESSKFLTLSGLGTPTPQPSSQ